MTARPWMKFYPGDWRADEQLRMCSLAARGLWIECIALMHRATPYGHLLVNGQAPTDAQLGVLAGAPSDQIPDLLRELETAGVFSRTRAGAIYSRRMTRDEKKARTAVKNGKTGGNPILGKQTDNSALVNPMDKPPDKAQRPETRDQKEEPNGSLSAPADRVDLEFQTLWSEWAWHGTPKGAKNLALEQWKAKVRRPRVDPATVIAGAKAYCRQCRDTDTNTQHVFRWLRDERWQDEYETAKSPADPDSQQNARIKGYHETGFWLPGWGEKPPDLSRKTA
jgi:hypothetical protein